MEIAMDEDRQQSPLAPPPANSPVAIRQLRILVFYIGTMLLLAICLELINGHKIPAALALPLYLALEGFGWLMLIWMPES